MIQEFSSSGRNVVYIREPDGSLVARFEPGENPVADYYYFDGLGSTVMMTQGLSTITDRYDYDAWGNEYPIMVSTLDNPYRYVGQLGYYTHWMDSSLTDLLHLGVRFYEPGVGRFSQVDPAREGENFYTYVDSAVLRFTDAFGLHNHRIGRVWIKVSSKCNQLSQHLQNVLAISVKWRDENQEEKGVRWNDLGKGKGGSKVGPIDDVAWQDPVTHKVHAYHTPNLSGEVRIECDPCKKEGEYWFTVEIRKSFWARLIGRVSPYQTVPPRDERWFYPVVE